MCVLSEKDIMADTHGDFGSSGSTDLLELDNQLCFALHAAARLVVRQYRLTLEQLGLTHPQYLVLLVLWAWDRDNMPRPTVHALGERLDLDSGTLTPLLKRLESRDLVTRTTPPHDRRERYIRLTETGRALRERAQHVPGSLLKKGPLPLSEIVQLRDQVNRLRTALATGEYPVEAVSAAAR
jgi:DNA-binding MarR family transcriptional regulator